MPSDKPQILFTTYDGLTDPLGQSQILPYFKGLSAKGFQITILSCEKKEAFENNSKLIHTLCDESKIDWQYEFYTKRPPIVSTVHDLKRLKKKALQLHREKNFSIVHCRTIVTAGIGRMLQKLGVKYLFDIRGFWADERVDGNLWNIKNPLYNRIYHYFKKREKENYLTADHIITLTQNAKQHLMDHFGLGKDRISVVPCTVDLSHFKLSSSIKKKAQQLKVELEINDKALVVCYSGSLGTRYLISEMLECFKEILKENKNAVFLIVTQSDTEELSQKIKKLGLSANVVITAANYSTIPAYIAMSDLALYFIYAGNSGKAVSPTKQAEFLSLGIPVITNSGIGDTKEIIEENNIGIVIDDFNKDNFEKIAKNIPTLLELPTTEMTEIAQQKFDLAQGIETYRSTYDSLISAKTK